MVADAWCESQGFTRAASYSVSHAEEATGAFRTASAGSAERPIAITCTR
jgi:hypothetical protein